MTQDIPMPDLDWGEGIEITLIAWLKHPGDQVAAGDVLAEVQSEKANVELQSPLAGVLAETLVPEGSTVVVGQPIARITTEKVSS